MQPLDNNMPWILAGFLGPHLLAIACFLLIAYRRSAVTPIVMALVLTGGLLIVLSPWLIPAEERLLRFLAAMSASLTAIKGIDAWLDLRARTAPSFGEFLQFLNNPFVLVRRCLPLERTVPAQENLWQLLLGSGGCLLGIALLQLLFTMDWRDLPFLVEHAVKVTALMGTIVAGLSAATALWRLSGGAARDYMNHPFAARTPADFWRRYNRNVQQFFWEDIFKPLGGHRNPVRTTLMVFGLSALLHEFIFYAAVGRVQGYQSAFFALQGVAVAMTLRIRPRRRWAAGLWITATLAFNLLSSVLFFASIHAVTPFYSRGLPYWLQGW